jgi:hypothetical protein
MQTLVEEETTLRETESASLKEKSPSLLAPSEQQDAENKPFGAPTVVEILRVLSTLLDPQNRQHTDSVHRSIAFYLLNVALEVGGHSLSRFISWSSAKTKGLLHHVKSSLSRKSSFMDMNLQPSTSPLSSHPPSETSNGSSRPTISMTDTSPTHVVDVSLHHGQDEDSSLLSTETTPSHGPDSLPQEDANSKKTKKSLVSPKKDSTDSELARLGSNCRDLLTNEITKQIFLVRLPFFL